MPVMLLLAKASVLLAVVLLVALAMRRTPASSRHGLWSAAFALLLALPVLAWGLPPLSIDLPAWEREVAPLAAAPSTMPDVPVAGGPVGQASTPPRADIVALDDASVMPVPPAPMAWPSLSSVLFSAWAAGAVAGLLALALALARAARLARGAAPLVDAGWTHAAQAASAHFGLRRAPRILMSADVVTPMAGGLVRPTVFVPAVARAWDAERRDIVLAHEIAHLAGRDPLRQIVARVALAIYWFHPLAWLAARQAEAAREQACDEAVLARGTRPSAYARVLLEFADGLPAAGPAVAALPIVQRSLLEKRLMAILSPDTDRRARRRVLLPAIAVALVGLPVAAAQPAHPAPVTLAPALATPELMPPAPMEAPVTDAVTLTPPAEQAAGAERSSCWRDYSDGTSFSGSISISDVGGRSVIHEQIGRRGSTRVMEKTFGDTRVCMLADGVGEADGAPSAWLPDASRVLLETRRGNETRRLVVEGPRLTWTVNGADRAPDAETASWRARVLAVLDPAWQLATLRGEESSLRGEISSVYGERSSLQGEISSLYGEVSSMRGEISSILGEESSLRGEISSIYGELSSLQGEISSERGEISSLNASRYDASDAERARIADRIRRHEAEIARLERQVREYDAAGKVAAVERRIAALDVRGQVEKVERQLRAFDVDAKVKAVQERLAGLDVDGKVAAIERQIAALDADARGRVLEQQLERAMRDLNR